MEGQIKGLILGIVGILVLALMINIGIGIYEPTAVKNAVEATANQTFTVDGTTYTVTGNGDSAADAVQETHDSMTAIRVIANSLLGVVFLVLVILSAVKLFGGSRRG